MTALRSTASERDEGCARARSSTSSPRRRPSTASRAARSATAADRDRAGGRLEIIDTHKPRADLIVHRGASCAARRGRRSRAPRTRRARREAIRLNHSATHSCTPAAPRLGEHVRQAGSLVAPDRLRFDFNHTGPWRRRARRDRGRGQRAHPRERRGVSEEMAYDDAIKPGALAFFGDKYGDRVRVVAWATSRPSSAAAPTCAHRRHRRVQAPRRGRRRRRRAAHRGGDRRGALDWVRHASSGCARSARR